jgi:chromosome segregation ATPase
MNGNGNGINGTARGLLIGVPVAAMLGVGGFIYKSIDDRIEIRRQDVAKMEFKVLDHEGKIERNAAQLISIEKELAEIKATLHEVQQEQQRRTPYIRAPKP